MNMKRSAVVAIMALSAVIFVSGSTAEQATQDMYATVTINKVFSMVLDNALIDFGYAQPGDTIELKTSSYYNEVKCQANKGTTWHLKIAVMGTITGPDGNPVAPEIFKWQVFDSTGDGDPVKDWTPFSATPKVAYTSGQSDMAGREALVRFKYKLDLPKDATGGNYRVRVLYTMTDNP
ncbi:MAG: hypothetical protein WC779_08395 [Candidatus Omnitrophota bacterium]